MEKIDETSGETGRSPEVIRTVQLGKQTVVADTKPLVSMLPKSRWANRFITAAIAQGALAAGVTSWLLYDAVYGSPG
ncbi:MAG TPA: hypothetical protein VFE96_04695, partial [Candidatus Bathyarchaeia archaeon]|nr:hypothetical protein [Candidatus Bathyarchaeia archaeon]